MVRGRKLSIAQNRRFQFQTDGRFEPVRFFDGRPLLPFQQLLKALYVNVLDNLQAVTYIYIYTCISIDVYTSMRGHGRFSR